MTHNDSFGRDTSVPEITETKDIRGEGCIEGMKCPSCGQAEVFCIYAKALFRVKHDGTDEFQNVEWDKRSFAECPNCNWRGKVKDLYKD